MTYALLLAFFRNDMGFGGNNGLTDFKDILGFNIQSDETRAVLFCLSAITLASALIGTQAIVTSKFGKVLHRHSRRRNRAHNSWATAWMIISWLSLRSPPCSRVLLEHYMCRS